MAYDSAQQTYIGYEKFKPTTRHAKFVKWLHLHVTNPVIVTDTYSQPLLLQPPGDNKAHYNTIGSKQGYLWNMQVIGTP